MADATAWWHQWRRRYRSAREGSPWWSFSYPFTQRMPQWVKNFVVGEHRFLPLQRYHFPDDTVVVWHYWDRLAQRLLYQLIQSTFRYLISPLCVHLAGPNAVGTVTRQCKAALNTGRYQYLMRLDIKGYYASISRERLWQQVKSCFDDPRVLHYLQQIITSAIDDGGNVELPTHGIPLRGSFSPFFAAVYLTPLDHAFEHAKGIFYRRFNDDIIILTQTKRQYRRARKKLFQILDQLELRLAPHKTKMGELTSFHLLGVAFDVAQTTSNQTQVTAAVHPRSCCRALDRVREMSKSSKLPALLQAAPLRTQHATFTALRSSLSKTCILSSNSHN